MKILHLIAIAVLVTLSFYVQAQNNCMTFDGDDDFVHVVDELDLEYTSSYTIEAWIKTDVSSSWRQIISKFDAYYNGWGFQIEDGALAAYHITEFGVLRTFVIGSIIISDDNWHHAAMVYDAELNTISLYADGVLDIEQEVHEGTITTTAKTYIGAYDANGNPGEFWRGSIDEIRVWDRAMSSDEIADQNNSEIDGSQEDLLLYYKFDLDDAPCGVVDASANELHGIRGDSGQGSLPQYSSDVSKMNDVESVYGCFNEPVGNAGIVESKPEVILYPNPTKEYLQVLGLLQNESYSIFNMQGTTVAIGIAVSNEEISVRGLSKGLYFLKLESGAAIKFAKD